jgi:hypothetical protein
MIQLSFGIALGTAFAVADLRLERSEVSHHCPWPFLRPTQHYLVTWHSSEVRCHRVVAPKAAAALKRLIA